MPADALECIRTGRPIADAMLAALAAFTQAMVDKRGNPSPEDATAFLKSGYTEQHILAVILAISVKIISNYANHLFHTSVDAPFACTMAPHGDCELTVPADARPIHRSAKARRFGPPAREKPGWAGVQSEARAERRGLSNPVVRISVGEARKQKWPAQEAGHFVFWRPNGDPFLSP